MSRLRILVSDIDTPHDVYLVAFAQREAERRGVRLGEIQWVYGDGEGQPKSVRTALAMVGAVVIGKEE